MDNKYSEAVQTLREEYELFHKIDSGLTNEQREMTMFASKDFDEFYNILTSKTDYTKDQLTYINDCKNSIIAVMTSVWTELNKQKSIDKTEFAEKYIENIFEKL